VTEAHRMRAHSRGWRCAVAFATVLLAAPWARAEPPARAVVAVPAVTKVTVVDPPADDRLLVEAALRIRAELDAAGLSNRAVACAGGVSSAACDATASAAAIALSRQDGLATIRVIATLPDGYELHRLIRVPPPAGGDDPAVLAVRAVELLRDIYLDVPRDFPRREQAKPQPPPVVTQPVPWTSYNSHTQMRVFLGAAMLAGRRGLGPSIAPVVAVVVPLRWGLSLAGTTAAPFDRLVGDAETGSASTTQGLVMAGGRYELALGRVTPFAALSTGLHYIRAEGASPQPTSGFVQARSMVAPLLAMGAGVSVWFYRWLAATAQFESFYTQPMTDVVVGGVIVGRAGGPSLLVQLGLSISLGER
jgi:hypothetical protein